MYTKILNLAAEYDLDKGSPMVWLSFIAHNGVIDRVRALGRKLTASDYSRALVADYADLSDERLIREEKVENRWREIDGLPDPEQTYIRSAYLSGLTNSLVAEGAGAPLGTIKNRMRSGLMALRAQVRRD